MTSDPHGESIAPLHRRLAVLAGVTALAAALFAAHVSEKDMRCRDRLTGLPYTARYEFRVLSEGHCVWQTEDGSWKPFPTGYGR